MESPVVTIRLPSPFTYQSDGTRVADMLFPPNARSKPEQAEELVNNLLSDVRQALRGLKTRCRSPSRRFWTGKIKRKVFEGVLQPVQRLLRFAFDAPICM